MSGARAHRHGACGETALTPATRKQVPGLARSWARGRTGPTTSSDMDQLTRAGTPPLLHGVRSGATN